LNSAKNNVVRSDPNVLCETGVYGIVSYPDISGGHSYGPGREEAELGSVPHMLGWQAERITIRCPVWVDRLCSTRKAIGQGPARAEAKVLPQRKASLGGQKVVRQYVMRLGPVMNPVYELRELCGLPTTYRSNSAEPIRTNWFQASTYIPTIYYARVGVTLPRALIRFGSAG